MYKKYNFFNKWDYRADTESMHFFNTFTVSRNFCFTKRIATFISTFFLFILSVPVSCTGANVSVLSLSIFNTAQKIGLTALNQNAIDGAITDPQKSPYLYFGLPEGYNLEGPFPVSALELTLNIGSTSSMEGITAENSGNFLVSFLYETDFTSSGNLKKELTMRESVQGIIHSGTNFTLSFALDSMRAQQTGAIRGFAVYSTIPIYVQNASLVPAEFGWSKRKGDTWTGFSSEGGSLLPELFAPAGKNPTKTDFLGISDVFSQGNDGGYSGSVLKVLLRDEPSDMGPSSKQNRVTLSVDDDRISIRRAPNQTSVILDGALFLQDISTVTLEENAHMIEGLVIELGVNTADDRGEYFPIQADPGLLVDWPQSEWRREDFEVFLWEQFPSVLFFDFADYAIQDEFLKRLAFYVEKKGYIGELWTHEEIKDLHAFNAQDYRAESLVNFFNQAYEEEFPLNDSELLLRDILLENGIIVRNSNSFPMYLEGRGAIVSISRETPDYLRPVLLTHEGLHGIYFMENDFRNKVLSVYNETDPLAVEFLRRYFQVSPPLNYDVDDDYLMKNEFMAYLLQRSPSRVESYFVDTISNYTSIGRAEPDLCEYIKDTRARAFVQAAKTFSEFLYKGWGLYGGRITLVSIQ